MPSSVADDWVILPVDHAEDFVVVSEDGFVSETCPASAISRELHSNPILPVIFLGVVTVHISRTVSDAPPLMCAAAAAAALKHYLKSFRDESYHQVRQHLWCEISKSV